LPALSGLAKADRVHLCCARSLRVVRLCRIEAAE
jgi:hypothetical protein